MDLGKITHVFFFIVQLWIILFSTLFTIDSDYFSVLMLCY